jgi:hypothetical protein
MGVSVNRLPNNGSMSLASQRAERKPKAAVKRQVIKAAKRKRHGDRS